MGHFSFLSRVATPFYATAAAAARDDMPDIRARASMVFRDRPERRNRIP